MQKHRISFRSMLVVFAWAFSAGVSTAARAAEPVLFKPDAVAWEKMKEAAKKEGKVVVAGPGFPLFRANIAEAFKKTYGVSVEYLALRTGDVIARVERESKGGQMSIDLNIGGTSICWTMAERGLIDDARALIVDPTLFDAAKWKGGQMRPILPAPSLPKDFYCGLQTSEWVMTDLFVNTKSLPAGSIKNWRDLLKPEYKGKIASFDPRLPGPAQTTAGYLRTILGDGFLRDLYAGQEVVMTADADQLSQWVARGTYPIVLSALSGSIEAFRKQGLPIERVFPEDGPGILTGGFGTVFRYKGGPNPNAAALFMNWFAGKEAQEIAEGGTLEPSLRADTAKALPAYLVPRPGVDYKYNDWHPDYFFANRRPAVDAVTKILAR